MKHLSFVTLSILLLGCTSSNEVSITGELKKWHRIELTFNGPESSETDDINPFLDYRLDVTFSNGDTKFLVPGFYAADGNAAETSAESGNKWKVRFVPNKTGTWNYEVAFVTGTNAAVENSGTPTAFDGTKGSFEVLPSDKSGKDFRAKGRLIYNGSHYLKHEGTNEFFIKGGVDSPENLLGYIDFDGTYFGGEKDVQREGESITNGNLHRYEPHIVHWNEGDPTWKNGKGKGLIGGMNYLASQGINSAYMLTNNVIGDGKDVFPWIAYESDFRRFDVSKLDQWEIVFNYMDQLGIMCHFVTQETENELLLNNGDLGLERKLYYRELIARFAHHLGVTWNMGEENGVAPWAKEKGGQNDQQRRDMSAFVKNLDPYKNIVVQHTLPSMNERKEILGALLGHESLDGPSLQNGNPLNVHETTLRWRTASAKTNHPWIVNSDEIGPHHTGAKPDEFDPTHDTIRHHVLWGNLMAGGGGVEWYFGYKFPHTDLTCEDWTVRETLWEQTKIAREFFETHVDLANLNPNDRLASGGYAIESGNKFIIYKPKNQNLTLNIEEGNYQLSWFDPRNGGALIQSGNTDGQSLPAAPNNPDEDWIIILTKS
ncbi:MAG: DUF5060 domain-containing protein [Cyclobacteriaceae bacterium]